MMHFTFSPWWKFTAHELQTSLEPLSFRAFLQTFVLIMPQNPIFSDKGQTGEGPLVIECAK